MCAGGSERLTSKLDRVSRRGSKLDSGVGYVGKTLQITVCKKEGSELIWLLVKLWGPVCRSQPL